MDISLLNLTLYTRTQIKNNKKQQQKNASSPAQVKMTDSFTYQSELTSRVREAGWDFTGNLQW